MISVEQYFIDNNINFNSLLINFCDLLNEDLNQIDNNFSFCFHEKRKEFIGCYINLKNYSYLVSSEKVEIIRKDNFLSSQLMGSKQTNDIKFFMDFILEDIVINKTSENIENLLQKKTVNFPLDFTIAKAKSFSNIIHDKPEYSKIKDSSHQFKKFKIFYLNIYAKKLFNVVNYDSTSFFKKYKQEELSFFESSFNKNDFSNTLDIINLTLDIDIEKIKKYFNSSFINQIIDLK